MKVLIINSVIRIKSTGKIAAQIAKKYMEEGHECRIAYGRECHSNDVKDISIRIGTDASVRKNALLARLFDSEGLNAKARQRSFLPGQVNIIRMCCGFITFMGIT